jgi:hypothetical protein
MRRLIFLICLILPALGCGTAEQDIEAARQQVRKMYARNGGLEFNLIEGPEYADIPKIPRDHLASWAADRSAACGVRIKFTWSQEIGWEFRTTQDDWVVWVSKDHKPVGYSANGRGDDWRQLVHSAAKPGQAGR